MIKKHAQEGQMTDELKLLIRDDMDLKVSAYGHAYEIPTDTSTLTNAFDAGGDWSVRDWLERDGTAGAINCGHI
jgi:hypothetical protein